MIYLPHFKKFVIKPTLKLLTEYNPKMYSKSAINLLAGTALHESRYRYLRQVLNGGKDGVARGFYQIESNTLNDVYTNFLDARKELKDIVEGLRGSMSREEALITNMAYATAIARIVYWRAKGAIPNSKDYEGLAKYHKTHYNTVKGATIESKSKKDFALAIYDGELPTWYA